MSAHFILVDSNASHGGENCIVAHRSAVAPRSWKHKASSARERLQLAQNFRGLL
jgi:hypothetical protein